MASGKLIVIEAGDGSGKATQTARLLENLRRTGRAARAVTFPDYESAAAAPLKMYLQGEYGERAQAVNAYAASTFFAVDRFASFQLKWREDYEHGKIIVADRYTTSNMVHQAVKLSDPAERDEFLRWLDDFEYAKLGLPRPDGVIYLDMDPAVAARLIAARVAAGGQAADIHERDRAYLARCHAAYTDLAARYGWTRIICAADGAPRDRDAIAAEVFAAVEKIL